MMASCSQTGDSVVEDVCDEHLAVASQTDAHHFTAIYERFADRLYRYALERTRSPQAADDVVSETMLAAIESIARFNPDRGSLAAWLFTIARRRLADRQRARNRMFRLLNRFKIEGSTSAEQSSDRAVESAIDVRAALSRLSASDREVLLLRYSADLPTIQIAEVLEISHGATRVRLSRALDRLRQELGRCHE